MSRLARRRFLSYAGIALPLGSALTPASGGGPGNGPAYAQSPSRQGQSAAREQSATRAESASLSFAMITDTHANVDVPDRTARLGQVFASIDNANPDFVLHCGDITDYGAQDEFQAYLGAIPERLRPRIRHVPGNHEVRWNADALELYHRLFGPTPFSFDIGGLHVIGLDPTMPLQEPGRFGADDLSWLANDLRAAGDRPSICFLHYPFGSEHVYVNNAADFLATVAGTNLRGIFAGHIHTQEVLRFDGLTQVAGDDARSTAIYYWVERTGDALAVSAVTLAADGTEQRVPVTQIPLTEPAGVAPSGIAVDVDASRVRLRVTLAAAAADRAQSVQARVYPFATFGGNAVGGWTALARSGNSWAGDLDASALVPGNHRVQVHVTGDGGAAHDAEPAFAIGRSAGTPVVRWQARMTGMVQAALGSHAESGVVVAASTTGDVRAYRPTASGPHERWRVRLGPVRGGPLLAADGLTAYVPSLDHHLHALDAHDGRTRWRHDAGAPVLSTPVVASIDGEPTILYAAGSTLFAVDPSDGAQRWSADLQGFSAGAAACDGVRVYAGSGSGNAYAFDARTGERLWSVSTNTRTTPYDRLLYGPWTTTARLLPGSGEGAVFVGTVASGLALDRATGATRWTSGASYLYTPSTLLPGGLLVIDEWGRSVRLLDPSTGTPIWQAAQLGTRPFDAGPVVRGSTAWLVTSANQLVRLDVADGGVPVGSRLQLGPAWCFSTPALLGDLLIAGDQSGTLRGITLPPD